jgi:hypothetical protein
MNLGDLLDELRSGLLRDVSDQVSGDSDQLWSDAQLVRYIDQAQRRFAQRGEVIRDGITPEVCQFTTVANQDTYQLHKSIISVLSVKMTGDRADLTRAGHNQLDTYTLPDGLFFDPSQLATLPPGKPVAWTTDETNATDDYGTWMSVVLRLFPIVSSDYASTLGKIRVVRYPINRLTPDNLSAIPEVPEDYHLNMLDWAAYLALRQADLDIAGGNARGLAKDYAASFEQHCVDAKHLSQKKLRSEINYAFGRNGWSYNTI